MLAQGSSLSGARSYFRECSFPVALGTLSNKFSTKRQINRELCVSELWALREAVSARRALVLPSQVLQFFLLLSFPENSLSSFVTTRWRL